MSDLLGLSEVAAKLGVTRDWLRRATVAGEVPAYKLGQYWRYDPAELETWLLGNRNQTDFPRAPQPRIFTDRPASQKHLEPADDDMPNAVSADDLAERLQIPVEKVRGWVGGLVPGRKIGSQHLITAAIAAEVVEIITADGRFDELPRGRTRTESAANRLEQEMLRRVGIGSTVRSWRYHRGGDQPIRWVPKPERSRR